MKKDKKPWNIWNLWELLGIAKTPMRIYGNSYARFVDMDQFTSKNCNKSS